MKKKFMPIMGILGIIILLLVGFWYFILSQTPQTEYFVNLNGQFASYEKRLTISKPCILVFDAQGQFKLKCPESISHDAYGGMTDPWGDIIYFTVTYQGETKRLAGVKSQMKIMVPGEIILSLEYDKEDFNPNLDKIWTGKYQEPIFSYGSVSIKIFELQGDDKVSDIPGLKSLTETEKDSILSVPSVFKPGFEILKRAMSLDDNNSKYNFFGLEPLPKEEQEKIKKDFKNAINLLKSTFEFGGEENEN
ncbi:MAG: hypothetical protein U9O55_02990 [Patescibacteria group bacterium]|nr:hypothetical protein [Patescibacteria group bacterium]